ncbi:Cell division coordinator CpoB [Arenibacter antarcticus]|uniref:Tetratricopeptide repeat protein n=1 Tax=Arenibacter antarcticus TaxID=2040469 RepID=A0ABW5VKM0_9FLAO|nr:tetratricopeptide repeat protein [Arenibacter sp. H213]MCM4166667.1 ion channel protein [Arenibacter sp. H213]
MVRLLTVLFFTISALGYAQNQQLFEEATTFYNDGEYQKAADNYLKILDNGEHSAALYFNLGNTYYKLNDIAPSIYYYEKALLLKPYDQDILNNLNFARNMTLDAIEPLPQSAVTKLINKVTSFLTFDQWAYIAVVFMILFVGFYISFYYFRFSTQKRIAFISSLVFLVFTLCAAALAYVQYDKFKTDRPAVVFAEQAPINSEPNNRSQLIFNLHAGTKVKVVDQLNDWKKIEIADGKTGWLLANDIKELKDF